MSQTPDSTGLMVGIVLFYGFIIVLSLASFVFWVVEIIDAARRQWPDPNSKIIWLLVVVLLHGLGALIYYFAGKPSGWLPGEAPRYGNYPPNSPPSPPGVWPPSPGSQ